MSLAARVAHNTIMQLIGKIASTILGLAAISVITRYLGQEGFGQYTIILTFLSFFGVIIDFGLTLVTTQMISQSGADQTKIINNLFTIRLISAIIFLGLAPIAIIFFPYAEIVKTGAILASLSFLFIALNQIFIGLFQKELRMDKAAWSEFYSRLVLLLGVIIVAYYKLGLLGVMAVTSVSSAINFLFNLSFARPWVKIKLAFDKDIWFQIVDKSWPLAITIFFNLIYLKADTLILSLIKTPAEVGIYGAAYKVIDILISIPFMFAGLVLPILSLKWAEKNTEGFKDVFQKSFDVMVIMAVPMFFGTQFISLQTMTLVAGQEFASSAGALRILIGAAGIIFLGTIFSHAVIAINQQKKLIIGYVFTSLTALIGYLIFIPVYSYYGAAWMTIYSEAVIALFTAYLFWKKARIMPKFDVFFKSLAASLMMSLVLYGLSYFNSNLFLRLAVGAATYFACLYLLKGMLFISFKEIFNLKNK